MPVFSAQAHNATVSTFARHWKADWVICSLRLVGDEARRVGRHQDGDLGAGGRVAPSAGVIETLKHEKVRPIAMSRFGEHWLNKASLTPCTFRTGSTPVSSARF